MTTNVTKMSSKIKSFEDAVTFHGHACPGLAIGYRASEIALTMFDYDPTKDEDLVCIAENDACSVDGIQFVSGCTLGKGNLIFRDYGKQVYTFIPRDGTEALRVSLKTDASMDTISPEAIRVRSKVFAGTANPEEIAIYEKARDDLIELYLHAPAEELFTIEKILPALPERARIFNSGVCSICGELVSESRSRVQDGKIVCIPCYNDYAGINR